MQDDEQHVDNDIDAYALGALEAGELAEVENHLAHCPRCQALAREARATAQALLYATSLVEPPPDLRARVLARVHEVATQHARAGLNTHTSQPAADPEVTTTADAGTPLVPAAGQGAGGLGHWLRGLRREQPATGDEIAIQLNRLMSDPACQIWQLGATNDAPGASARLVGTPTGRDAVLLTAGLRALPADHAYQVWFLRGGQPIPNALFQVVRGGVGRQIVHAPTRLGNDLVVAVTPEPAGGSPAPTGPIVLMGELGA